MSEIPNTKNLETEKGSETLTENLYELSQESPREFARTWQNERDSTELMLPDLDDFFRKKFIEHGGEDADLTEMSQENMRLLYSLRAAGDEFSIVYNNLADEISGNQAQAESFTRFKQEQDARASRQHDRPPLPGDDFTEWILESFENSPAESPASTPSVENLGDIQSRLSPAPAEPLSEATKKSFFDLSRATDPTFEEKLAQLDGEQQQEVRAYIKQSYENMKVAEMSPERRKQYFAAQKEEQASEQEKVAEMARQDALEVAVAQESAQADEDPEAVARRENPQSEEDYKELHALKLSNGAEFKDVYINKLSPEQQVKFDAREAKYDARLMVEDPDYLIPRLSKNGSEWTSISGPKPENDPTDGALKAEAPDSTPLISRGGNVITSFNHEYQADEAELKNLADMASSSDPETRKSYADAVKSMPAEKFTALSKYRTENPSASTPDTQHTVSEGKRIERRTEGTLSENYMRSMYKDAHSNDPRLREAFAAESREWDAVERNQYVQYSATIQTGMADQARQQPQAKPGPFRRLWNRRPWGKKK